MVTENCPLCAAGDSMFFHRDRLRQYRRCQRCKLVFVPPDYYLSRVAEHAYYQQHENHVDDPGYRQFLSRLADPLAARLASASVGLDFGCGPGPALAAMLTELGHSVGIYDSFFFAEPAVLHRTYDFISASEVVEHLHEPGEVLARLWGQLRAGAWLGVMTKLVLDKEAFVKWHYIRDPTHVCFFSRETWIWWAACSGARVEFVGADVILLQKSVAHSKDCRPG